MAYQELLYVAVPYRAAVGTSGQSFLLDAAGEKCAFVFRAPKAGDLRKVRFRLATVTTGQTLKASLQDVDLTTGDPDGTVDQSGTVAVADTDDNTWKEVTFGADRTVAVGDYLAVVIEFDSTVGNLNVLGSDQGNSLAVYADHFTAAWAKQARSPLMVLEYSDATIVPVHGCTPLFPSSTDFNSGSTPDERALRVSLPFPCKVLGAEFYGYFNSGDVDLVLYSGTTAERTLSLDGTVAQANTTASWMGGLFPSGAYTLAANTEIRIAVKPTSATSVRLYGGTVNAAGDLAAAPGGSGLYHSQRTDAGAWSDTTTQRPGIVLLVSALDDGVGGGGGLMRHPGMTGGCPA